VIDACEPYPWATSRGLSGYAGAFEFIDAYAALLDLMVALWRFFGADARSPGGAISKGLKHLVR